jgi:hypothetical protein
MEIDKYAIPVPIGKIRFGFGGLALLFLSRSLPIFSEYSNTSQAYSCRSGSGLRNSAWRYRNARIVRHNADNGGYCISQPYRDSGSRETAAAIHHRG